MYAVQRLGVMKTMFGGVCQIEGCKEIECLEFAHRIKTKVSGSGRGSWIRLKDVIENPLFYILMCPTHHLEYDGKQQLKEEYQEPQQKFDPEQSKKSLFITVFKYLEGQEKKPVYRKDLIIELIKTGKFTINESFGQLSKLHRAGEIYESKPNYFNLVDTI